MTNNIEVKDHNSKIIHLIPSDLREPVSLIAKIKGFESVDDYVEHNILVHNIFSSLCN